MSNTSALGDATPRPRSSTCSMQDVPDEVIEYVFDFLPARTLAIVSGVSRRLRRLSNKNSSWRRHCRHQWRYWHPHHKIRQLLQAPTGETQWRQLYISRSKQDNEVIVNFEQVLLQQKGRIEHTENITKYGYDAKDVLLSFSRCPDSFKDVLARRYWAVEILGSIEREVAIQTWEMVRRGEDVPLEHALGSFDLWITQQPNYSLEDISVQFDTLATSFLSYHKDDMNEVSNWSSRKKAVELGVFLSKLKMIRHPSPGQSYRFLSNTLIGVVLADTDHDVLPLVGAAIFCCLASRIGLNAYLTNFPFHVYINVPAPQNFDHDGNPARGPVEALFIDPWSGCEVPSHTLKVQLERLGHPDLSFDECLRPASTLEMLNRMGNNIHASIEELGLEFETVVHNPSSDMRRKRRRCDPGTAEHYQLNESLELNPFRANYCVWWLQIAMLPHDTITEMEGSQTSIQLVNLLMQQIASHHHDISLIEKYILPHFSKKSMEYEHLSRTVSKRLRVEDATARPVHHRPSILKDIKGPNNDFSDTVRYRIGDVFRHKRYGYTAIIIGWDPACMASQSWIDHMGIETLHGGRKQSFYNVFVDDRSTRYVAEENIQRTSEIEELCSMLPHPNLMREAGKWFQRFDLQQQRFISNMVDEYPDD